MANPEVEAALAERPPGIYGLDRRAEDDGVYVVRWGSDCLKPRNMGSGFDMGDACEEGTPNCYPIRPAIALFVDRLKELERQTRKAAHCSGIDVAIESTDLPSLVGAER
jgi:hypothetical protein